MRLARAKIDRATLKTCHPKKIYILRIVFSGLGELYNKLLQECIALYNFEIDRQMLILGLMWVASWFGGIPNVGGKFLDTPKFLTHILCHSRVCQPTLLRAQSAVQASSSLQPILTTAQVIAQDFPRTAPTSDDRGIAPTNWVSTIEHLLSSASNSSLYPLTELFGSVQSLFSQLPIVASSEQTPASVAIVEVGYDGIALSQSESASPRFGFWQCPTNQISLSRGFQLWVKGCQVATVRDRSSAQILAQQLHQLLEIPNLDASNLRAAIDNGRPVAKLADRTIFRVSESLAARLGRPAEVLTIEWVNNLRIALGQTSISLVDAQVEMHQLSTTENSIGGMASWYGPYFHGRQTANGEIFDQEELTAAHPTLPLGTFLKVTNRLNGKSIVVRVNDRGPYFDNRVLDLSRRAASIINSEDRGVVPIEAVIMQPTITAQTKQPPQQVARLVTGY